MIFSAENLFGISSASMDLLAKALSNSRTTIVMYLRRQDEWLESLYVEWTTGSHWRNTSSFAEYRREQEAAGMLDYANLVGRWADRFGRENILIRPLGRLQGNGRHIQPGHRMPDHHSQQSGHD